MTNQDADAGGRWRFARFDGRFVFDYDDGRKGFRSPKFFDVDPFAEYVNALEVALREAEARAAAAEALLRASYVETHGLIHAYTDVDGQHIDFDHCSLWICKKNRRKLDALTPTHESATGP